MASRTRTKVRSGLLFAVAAAFLFATAPQIARAEAYIDAFDALTLGRFEKAASLFRKSAREGNISAFFMLGVMHETGQGVKKSYSDAAILYTHAAKNGHKRAQIKLGQMHAEGKGVKPNRLVGYMWLEVAAQSGQQEAFLPRSTLALKMKKDDVDTAVAMAKRCLVSKFKSCK